MCPSPPPAEGTQGHSLQQGHTASPAGQPSSWQVTDRVFSIKTSPWWPPSFHSQTHLVFNQGNLMPGGEQQNCLHLLSVTMNKLGH